MGKQRWSALLALALCSTLATGCVGGRAYATGESGRDESRGNAVTERDGELDEDGDADDEADGSDGYVPSTATLIPHEELTSEMMFGMLSTFAYRGAGFRRANGPLFPSTVAPGKWIDMWVSEAALDEMLAISPERAGSEVEVPTGTMIVREVYDGTRLATITVMVKLEQGAFPLGGDFWYSVTDPDGTVRLDADGLPIEGLRPDCGSCHLRRSHDGFLFGTPDGYLPQ
jgi:hypothetical protein